jgi:hypothetical protein
MSFISIVLILFRKAPLVFIVLLASHTRCVGQFVQTSRFEIPVTWQDGSFDVVPASKDGVFLFRRLVAKRGDQLEVIKLDTAFVTAWQGYLEIDRKFEIMGKKFSDKKLYLLLRHREIVRKDLQIVIMDSENGTFRRHDIRNYVAFIPDDFQVSNEAVVIGGYFNAVPVVIHYSIKRGTSKVLPGLLNESGELTQIKMDSTSVFHVLISARNIAGQKTIWIRTYDPEGDLISQFPLKPHDNRHLIFARALTTDQSTQILAGTYGNRNSEYSKGIFIATIDPNGSQNMRYYNYGDLKNFFKYMRAGREQRVKERIERRKVKGKITRFNYRFIVHEIVPYRDQFIMLGEAFYPKYINVDRRFGNFFISNAFSPYRVAQNGRIFDGYHYTHAVVLGFDQSGNLLWDNSFEINDVKTFNLEQFVRLEPRDDHIALFYVFDNQLRSKIIRGNDVLEGKTYAPLRTRSDRDIAIRSRTASSKLEYWYDDYFYAFGMQDIANASTGARRVFFLNKMSYRED